VAGFDAFVKSTLYANANVRKFRSMIALDRVKAEPRLPV
jgi:Lrp/AsnC family leucine-responsive transcriptional regulator